MVQNKGGDLRSLKPSLPEATLSKAEQQSALFRVFGNPQRLLILWLLEEQERTLTEIALALGLTQLSASHHIRILEFHKLVHSRQEQEQGLVYYELVDRESLLNCRIFANKPQVMLAEVDLISSNPS
jgi:DNA-binding transcriptional ArsR family regulator